MFLAFGARLHLRQSLQRLVVVAHDSLILHGNCPFLPAGMHFPVVALAEGTLPWVVAHWLRAFQTCSQFVVHLALLNCIAIEQLVHRLPPKLIRQRHFLIFW